MTFTVSKRFNFEAAHSLPHLPKGHKCRNLHGHSYVVEVFCAGPVDKRGFVIDYAEISKAVNPLIERLDHRNLNDVMPNFKGKTTAENVGRWFMLNLAAHLPLLSRVDVYETARTCVRVDKGP